MTKKLLLTGAAGFLGFNVCRHLPLGWNVFGVARAGGLKLPGIRFIQADITRLSELERAFREVRPDAVIHAAAISNTGICQTNRAESHRVNVEASAAVAALCAEYSARCLFTSSDMVFDGERAPYSEEDPVSPINVYGEQKAMAELSMRDLLSDTIICRLAIMFGDPGISTGCFLQPMVDAMAAKREITLFVDEFRTPLSVKTAVNGLFAALEHPGMTFHLGGVERVSRFAFGMILREVIGTHDAPLSPRNRADLKLPAPRPRDLSLDITRARGIGFEPLPLKTELEALIAEKDDSK